MQKYVAYLKAFTVYKYSLTDCKASVKDIGD